MYPFLLPVLIPPAAPHLLIFQSSVTKTSIQERHLITNPKMYVDKERLERPRRRRNPKSNNTGKKVSRPIQVVQAVSCISSEGKIHAGIGHHPRMLQPLLY
jgi:hypothetical protein